MSGRLRPGSQPRSAAELAAELRCDPGFARRERQLADERRQAVERYGTAASGVLLDLAAAGFDVKTIGDLRGLGRYSAAVPILGRWLPRVQDADVKEDIVRTLSVPWAKSLAPLLVVEFERAADPTGTGLRWAIGNALEVLASDMISDELIRLATSRRFGRARQMVTVGLAKLRDPRVTGVLMSLLADEDVVGHAVMALGKLRAKEARAKIAPLLEHPTPWVRKEARRAMASIEKAR